MAFAAESKLCPIFTAAKLMAAKPEQLAPSSILGPDGGKPPSRELDGVRCQGTGCAWFQTMVDEKGQAFDGVCALPMINVSLGNIHRVGGSLAEFFANAVAQPKPPGSQPLQTPPEQPA